MARPEGLPDAPSDPQGDEAENARLLPDDVVAEPWHRHSRGERGVCQSESSACICIDLAHSTLHKALHNIRAYHSYKINLFIITYNRVCN